MDQVYNLTQLSYVPHQGRYDAALSWVEIAFALDGQAELVDDKNSFNIGGACTKTRIEKLMSAAVDEGAGLTFAGPWSRLDIQVCLWEQRSCTLIPS